MNFDLLAQWYWLTPVLAFIAGVQLTRWWLKRRRDSSERVNAEYFRGLNFLLNEEPDKAIEVFIKALEVDSETVELHLALGGLFRRKGQVDRATRIHQNLIARPSLTDEHRLQAIFELAQDYYKAGLLDRAENLFNELKDSISYRSEALNGLCAIYQQEKEWVRAIEVCKMHKRADRASYSRQIAHYWCELAELAIADSEYEEARRCLRSALSEDRSAARAVLLRGELHFRQQNFRRALDLWDSLSVANPTLATLVVEKSIRCYRALGDDEGLRDFLQHQVLPPGDPEAFSVWSDSLVKLVGNEQTRDLIIEHLNSASLSGPVAMWLEQKLADGSLPDSDIRQLLEELLNRAKTARIEYTCGGCGFDVKAMYWLCPNCGEWDSFSI